MSDIKIAYNDVHKKLYLHFKETEQQLNELNKNIAYQQERQREAASQGDLSENAEYHTAAEEINRLQVEKEKLIARRNTYQQQGFDTENPKAVSISGMQAIDNTAQIDYRSMFRISEGADEYTFMLVPAIISNARESAMSDNSPLGKAIVGHTEGDTIIINIRGKEHRYYIKEVFTP